MKNNFTFLSKMLIAFVFVAGISTSVFSQTSHVVLVGADGHVFSPSTVNIKVGDTVIWKNTSGEGHNVNGDKTDFPNNPESFGNSVGTSWTYTFVFNTVGKYDYQCNPHASHGMVGVVNVTSGNASVAKINKDYKVYPNPANDVLTIEMGNFVEGTQVSIIDITGKNILTQNLSGTNTQVSVSALPAGIYFYAIHSTNEAFTATEKLYIVK